MDNHDNDITLRLLFSTMNAHRKQLSIGVSIASLVVLLLMLSIPSYYRSDDIVGYEEESSTIAEGLRTVGLSQGFDTGKLSLNTDAFFPPHYFILLESHEFLAEVMQSRITTEPGDTMTYYSYLLNNPQKMWWQEAYSWLTTWDAPSQTTDISDIDPTRLTPQQEAVFESAAKHILCRANTNKNLVTVSVIDQDPYVCATMAVAVRKCLQRFVEVYRRKKMAEQISFYKKLVASADDRYQAAVREFNNYSQPHAFASRPLSHTWENHLRLKMMQEETMLNAIRTHLNYSISRLSEPTSLFTSVQEAAIPSEPDGPKRLVYVLLTASLTFTLMLLFFMRTSLLQQFK